jgi:hypothetical protein
MLFCRHYFSQLNTFMRKDKDPETEIRSWIRIREAQKHADSGSGYGSPTLISRDGGCIREINFRP